MNDIAICIDSLVNRLRGDLHDTQMQVITKPIKQEIDTDGDIVHAEGEVGGERWRP